MLTLPETREQLEALRNSLEKPYQEAMDRGDRDQMRDLTALAREVDLALNDLAIDGLWKAAGKLADLRSKIEIALQKAHSWPFGAADGPDDFERPARTLPEDAEFDDGDDAADAAPAPGGTVVPGPAPQPAPSGTASQAYAELWKTMAVQPVWTAQANSIARKIVANQGRYAAVVAGSSVPWWFVAVVHAMEAGLNFNCHLHNGDPLTRRTVQVPAGRPAHGMPPFTWEESARDAMAHDRLDKVTDWSLPSVLFNWHRFNGIKNEYQRRNIPTPYLWSGSQHYRKGKYVADGRFDPEAVSKQVGAAVILRMLIDLNAVTIDGQLQVASNPAAAAQDIASLAIELPGSMFKHVNKELDYPGPLALGAGKSKQEQTAVRHLQEWLSIHNRRTLIDGDFGASTQQQLQAFQVQAGRQPTGQLDPEVWALLIAPMRRALATIDHGNSSLEGAVMRIARQHLEQQPIEIGGNNRGPWVRLYMEGKEGEDQKWCAGFVCFLVAQAARDLGIQMPFGRQVGVDQLVQDAKASGRFISEADLPDDTRRRSKLREGCIFVVRNSPTDWTHTGFVATINKDTFDTMEGNTGGDGGADGANTAHGNRSYVKKDFLRLL